MSTYETYDATSSTYDDFRRPIDVPNLLESVKSVAAAKNIPLEELKFLDVGCGTGFYIMTVAKELKCQCFGLEYSKGMLSKLQEKAKGFDNVSFQQGNAAERLPFDDDSFDFVMASQMLHHLPAGQGKWDGAKTCLSEAARVARPGGSKFWLQTQMKEQHINGFWWAPLIARANLELAERMPSIDFIKDTLAAGGMQDFVVRIPPESLINDKYYLDPEGPLRVEFRNGDSNWALVTEEEMKACHENLKNNILVSKEATDKFMADREAVRKEIGQTTTVLATFA